MAKLYDKPARYRVTERSYLYDADHPSGRLVDPGMEIDYSGHPGTALEPLDDEARKRKAYYAETKGMTADEVAQQKRVLTEGAADVSGGLDALASGGTIVSGKALADVKPAAPVPIPDDEPLPGQVKPARRTS